jgi:hypothetical protein
LFVFKFLNMNVVLLSLALIFLAASNATKVFKLDCKDTPGPCNNDCYAVFTAGRSQVRLRNYTPDIATGHPDLGPRHSIVIRMGKRRRNDKLRVVSRSPTIHATPAQ